MLKLKNVSKFYYSRGVIASGFSKINLELNMGEFVAITGESGSGKSTLLNVISGLDSYEEGEMYVNGEETSHYNEKDLEDYRRKYIGNIFQHFNLINSYTVYQNIELVLLLNGYKRKEIKEKVLDIIKEVELTKYKNTKVSKLSGGQKQRVAIARALAKDTPIIVADEPTGNLDAKSAESVLKILHKVSKGKLVVVVTHNFEQIEEYATRKIKMHDGRIIEDKIIKKVKEQDSAKEMNYKNITIPNRIGIAFRNTFNIIPKFLLLFLVYFFIVIVVMSQYASMQKSDNVFSNVGYTNYFSNSDEKRIIIKKSDNTTFTDNDYEKISAIENIDSIFKDDILLDMNVMATNDDDLWLYGSSHLINGFNDTIDVGRMPENANEVVIVVAANDWYFTSNEENILNQEIAISIDGDTKSTNLSPKIKIVGISYVDDSNSYSFYLSEDIMHELRNQNNEKYSTMAMTLNKKIYPSNDWSGLYYTVVANSKVAKGKALFPEEFNYLCNKFACKNATLNIKISNIYYEDSINLKVTNTYNSKTFAKLTGLKKDYYDSSTIFINIDDFNSLYTSDTYQSSVFVKSASNVSDTIKELESLGLKTLYVKDTITNPFEGEEEIFAIFRVVIVAIVIVGLFFISYFIIKLILKSRNIYFSTIRILGASKKISRQLLNMEMLVVVNIAYVVFLILVLLVRNEVINIKYIYDLIEYLKIYDYFIVYLILIIMSLLISHKFANKMFKSSVMLTYREEV